MKTALALTAIVLSLGGCATSDEQSTPEPTARTYTARPERPTTSPTEPNVEKTTEVPDSGFQKLSYGSSYRWNLDGASIAVYVSDPAVSRAVVTNAGTQVVNFNVTLKARTDWSSNSAKLTFDSKTNESFFLITAQGENPFKDDLNAGQTKVYKMKLEAPMDTYKQGSITLSYKGEKLATWS